MPKRPCTFRWQTSCFLSLALLLTSANSHTQRRFFERSDSVEERQLSADNTCSPTGPTLYPPKNFNATSDCIILNKAMAVNTDKLAIINILTKRSIDQRLEIAAKYQAMYKKSLRDALASKLSSDLLHAMISLTLSINDYYAEELYRAMAKLGTEEDVLVDIICTLDNAQMKAVKAIYDNKHGSLVTDVERDTSGDFEQFLVALLSNDRDQSDVINRSQAQADARTLYKAGTQHLGTDESKFFHIFSTRNFRQLRIIFDEYYSYTKQTIEYAIRKEFSKNAEAALLRFIKVVRNLQGYYIERLHDTMIRIGTNDLSLIRFIIIKCEVDMKDIMQEYYRIYQKPLEVDLYGATLQDYRTVLFKLIGYK